MKARKFPKIKIPDDLYSLEQYLNDYDTIQEQIDFLKFVNGEIKIFEENLDIVNYAANPFINKELEKVHRIVDGKLEFYYSILREENDKELKNGKFNDLKKFDLVNLQMALVDIKKDIKGKENFLDEAKEYFMRDGELWTINGINLMLVKDLLDKKTKEPLYTGKQIEKLKGLVMELNNLQRRRNNIFVEIKRKEWGEEYFDRDVVENEASNKNSKIVKEENAELETSKNKILQLRSEIKKLILWRKELKLDIDALNKEIEFLEDQFNNDIDEFPSDLSEKLEQKKQAIIRKQNEIDETEIKLWGFLGAEKEGIIWQHDRMVDEYKRIKIDSDELYEQLRNKSIEKKNEELKRIVRNILTENNISISDDELDEIVLEVLAAQLSNLEQFYEDVINEEKEENRLFEIANEVLKSKYDLRLNKTEVKRIKFATPRANRDKRLEELNEIIGKLEYDKMIKQDDTEYVKNIQSQLKALEEEYNELSIGLIGDFLLGNDIKDAVRKIIEDTKNETGLSYLDEVEYDTTKNNLIDESARKIFNKITNNEFEEKLTKTELSEFINEEITKLLPELDSRFRYSKENDTLTIVKTDVEKEQPTELEEVPPRQLKRLAKEACENLIKEKIITEILNETKVNKVISSVVIPKLETKFKLTAPNRRSIHIYFRKCELLLKKNKKGELIVVDTYQEMKRK